MDDSRTHQQRDRIERLLEHVQSRNVGLHINKRLLCHTAQVGRQELLSNRRAGLVQVEPAKRSDKGRLTSEPDLILRWNPRWCFNGVPQNGRAHV